ncbi:MAG: 50S ribosomal protein L25/general stress protein Ctc [Rhodospirillaceae bacterium]|jgi:large subunit ribosomal protein L25|nr:50S ribosomal protein L25/general stress protein Ctc [Rhodospirillaceae bacterium]MBT3910305.1 50S ribosomal protein L25/general stress protein Ctc [Rhodospirillaceae bacterium]MBT5299169.1 50S ribosomal protein L25/general stress protein Ctc [Rhodospirillaceae bacterium]MBT6085336.1 50S ribosomal protein L25/general stress protein Ctc [Rhodospirillaceae bacterium]MBT6609230.1 50S ribosomal protein L25/general stress protein Ctc [Rhodospirillaceae bacterium]
MAEVLNFAAEPRERAGKGAARATRREGRVPGVIYGNKQEPIMISINPLELTKQLSTPGFFARVYEVNVDGGSHRVLARDLQLDPVTDRPIHVDFMRFSASTRLNIEVEVVFENEEECPGIRVGGVLNVVRHTIELRCAPDSIPEFLTADLAGLEIGDSINISAIDLPGDVQVTITDRDFTIATIAAPTIVEEVEDETDEDEEGLEGAEGAEGGEGGDAAGEDSEGSETEE